MSEYPGYLARLHRNLKDRQAVTPPKPIDTAPEAAPAEAIQDPLCVICDSPICYPSANGKYYCSQDKPSWQEEEIEVSYEPKPESPQAEGEKSEQRQELDSMLKYLRRIIDFGGYDGYGQDDYLCKIADRLENEFKSRTSEQALHIAWRKRAEEAEAKIESQPSSLAGTTEEFPLRTCNNFFGVPSKHYAVCLREDVLKLAKQSQPVIEPDLLYSRNKWHMVCRDLGWDALTTPAATLIDAIRAGQTENAELKAELQQFRKAQQGE